MTEEEKMKTADAHLTHLLRKLAFQKQRMVSNIISKLKDKEGNEELEKIEREKEDTNTGSTNKRKNTKENKRKEKKKDATHKKRSEEAHQ